MANYSTQFSFSFSVGNKAGELIQQALTYFGEDEEDRDADVFSPEWESVFAAHNNEPENWANEVSGETATGCKFEVVTKDAETRVSVWSTGGGSSDFMGEIIHAALSMYRLVSVSDDTSSRAFGNLEIPGLIPYTETQICWR